MKPEPKFRRKLNTTHLAILESIYQCRYSSRVLLQDLLHLKHPSSIHRTLETLIEQGLVKKQYDKSYRLQGKPAIYYLTTKGIKVLRDGDKRYEKLITDEIVKASYADGKTSDSYKHHVINVFTIVQLMQAQHPNLIFFGKRELKSYDYFPEERPDAYLSLKQSPRSATQHFFLVYIPSDMPRYVFKQKLNHLDEFYDSGDWDVTNTPEPPLLLCTADKASELRIYRLAYKLFEDVYSSMKIYISNLENLRESSNGNVWTYVDWDVELKDKSKPIALDQILVGKLNDAQREY